jgi:predicted NBD/HSP70 family sugar kinase
VNLSVERDTPPAALQARTSERNARPQRPRGSNQIGMRQYNERVVLQAIRLHGAQPKADLARLTHLSTQTVSLIIDRLIADELLTRKEPVRGKVGQPSVPIALNPDGAFAVGVKLGRRSCDALLVDFSGHARERASLSYDYPEPRAIIDFVAQQLHALPLALHKSLRDRVVGLGLAAPLSLDGWQNLLGVAPARSAQWREVDLAHELAQLTALPVSSVKDTAAACVAELVEGLGRSVANYLYIYVDTFVGGGLVINHHLHAGPRGNAGAVASMPVGMSAQGQMPQQLLSRASLLQLEERYATAALDASALADARALQAPWRAHSQAWVREAAQALSLAAMNAACLLDIDTVIIDGSLGRELLQALIEQTREAMQLYNTEGIQQPELYAGTVGADARALGGALLPLYEQFAPDQDLFLK